MSIFIFFAYGVVLLMGTVIVISLGIIGINIVSIRREVSAKAHRLLLRQALLSYLPGEAEMEVLEKAMEGRERYLLGVVVQLAEESAPAARQKLIDLFEFAGFRDLASNELKQLASKNWYQRQQAAIYLPYVARPDLITQPLIRALRDDMLDVRLAAAHSLAKLKVTEAIAPILEHLALPASWPAKRIIEIMFEMGSDSSAPLLSYLTLPGAQDAAKVIAISVLGMQRYRDALNQLILLLQHQNKDVRVQSAKALGSIGELSALPALIDSMHDTAWEVRAASALALGLLKGREVLPVLVGTLCDSEWWVRYNSAIALSKLGSEGMSALKGALTHKDKFARDVSRLILQEQNFQEGVQP